MKKAKAWIEFNPKTGSTKPWEIRFLAEGGRNWCAASCKSKDGAEKALLRLIETQKRGGYYEMQGA